MLMDKNSVLKSLFKVRINGVESSQETMNRYWRYFERMENNKCDLIQELHSKCVGNPSIDVSVQELVVNLHELVCGGAK